jgi:hypothetical protein
MACQVCFAKWLNQQCHSLCCHFKLFYQVKSTVCRVCFAKWLSQPCHSLCCHFELIYQVKSTVCRVCFAKWFSLHCYFAIWLFCQVDLITLWGKIWKKWPHFSTRCLVLGQVSEPAPISPPWRMDDKWSKNSFLLGSSSLATHGG